MERTNVRRKAEGSRQVKLLHIADKRVIFWRRPRRQAFPQRLRLSSGCWKQISKAVWQGCRYLGQTTSLYCWWLCRWANQLGASASDNMKGRIIGQEGHQYWVAAGVDVIVMIHTEWLLSDWSIRREIARMTMEALLKDGRIHPALAELVEGPMEIDNRIRGTRKLQLVNRSTNTILIWLKIMGRLRSVRPCMVRMSFFGTLLRLPNFLVSSLAKRWKCQLLRRAGFTPWYWQVYRSWVEGSHVKSGQNWLVSTKHQSLLIRLPATWGCGSEDVIAVIVAATWTQCCSTRCS